MNMILLTTLEGFGEWNMCLMIDQSKDCLVENDIHEAEGRNAASSSHTTKPHPLIPR